MITMPTKETRTYFRSTPKLRGLYSRLQGALRDTDIFTRRVGYTSNDAIINALLMWAAEQDADQLARDLSPHLDRFEEIWSEVLDAEKIDDEDAPGVAPSTGPWKPGAVRNTTPTRGPTPRLPKRKPKDQDQDKDGGAATPTRKR